MTFLLFLILLVLVFGFGWLRGALRAICMVGAGAVALGLVDRLFDVRPETVVYVGLAVIGVGGFLVDRLLRRIQKPGSSRKS